MTTTSRGTRTLDDEGTCVRCGAPDLLCWCEAVEADGHWWVAPSVGANATEWTVCMKCGNVKRADGKPSSQCRGPVRVGLRRRDCGSTWEDPEVAGWIWSCWLPNGHDGDHRCHGATWTAGS